ncbi:MAG: nucleotidyltransferase family protein, partial [Clostridia bacterium]|nr:nucleotidyltransferase family protein [Clostridia bacterium]
MKVAGIIAEFNPFHNGHALLVQKAREAGYTHVIAVMSGNFVQRGEPAIFHHSVRT